jgi:hypothetical protein
MVGRGRTHEPGEASKPGPACELQVQLSQNVPSTSNPVRQVLSRMSFPHTVALRPERPLS